MNALGYLGSKSGGSSSLGAGTRIAALLPPAPIYAEPFAGMLGVLLQRQQASIEIANDIDQRIVNWWRALRDHTDELLSLIELTPWSRNEFLKQTAHLDDANIVRQALAVTVVLEQGLTNSLRHGNSWRRNLKGSARSHVWAQLPDRLAVVAERIKCVQLECKPAHEIIYRLKHEPEAVLYLDPPYGSAPSAYLYMHDGLDAVTDAVTNASARIAISGYNDEWDHLNWHRIEIPCTSTALGNLKKSSRDKRTEVVWLNYQPPQPRLFDMTTI